MKESALADAVGDRITVANATQGKWFISNAVSVLQPVSTWTIPGVYMRDATSGDSLGVGTDGGVSCDTPALIKGALSLWDLDPVSVLCNSGFRRYGIGPTQSVPKCIDSSTDFERREGGNENNIAKFTTYIKEQVYGGNEPELSDPEWYLYYRHSLNNSCIAGIDSKPPSLTPESSDNQYGYNNVQWVEVKEGSDPRIITGSYTGTWTNGTLVNLRIAAPSGYNPFYKTCAETAALMGNYANSFRLWARENIQVAITAERPVPPPPGDDDTTTSCAIEGVGWIICPVVNFLAGLADGAFGFLADNFLRTDPEFLNTEKPTYQAWSVMRTIANVAFVIVFLIIIFSQLTGLGVSNYGVKKMLPRIVIAAILVNVSFFVCQLAVDLSNILGYSIKDVFGAVGASIGGEDIASGGISPIATGEGFAGVAGSILAAVGLGVIGYALLSTLIPILLAAVVALVMILFILIARQALIILLIVISPLAFVAFLLPNTEGLFKKWRQALTAMLLLFPIIAVVFGASSLASGILSTTFTGGLSGEPSNWFGQLIAAAVMVLPLFVVPVLLKKSLDGIPAIGQLANKWSSRANGNIGRKLKEGYQGSLVGRGGAIRKQARESYRNTRFAERVNRGGLAGVLSKGIPITNEQRQANKKLMQSALAAESTAKAKETEEARSVFQYGDSGNEWTGAQKHDLAMGKKVIVNGRTYQGGVMQKAAIQERMQYGSYSNQQEIIAASGGGLKEFSQTISSSAATYGLSGKNPAFSGSNLEAISQQKVDSPEAYDKIVLEGINKGKFTAEAFASMDNDARNEVIKIAKKSKDPVHLKSLVDAANQILDTPELLGKMSGNNIGTSSIQELTGRGVGENPPPFFVPGGR